MNKFAKHWLRFHLPAGFLLLFLAVGLPSVFRLSSWVYAVMIPVGILGMISQTFHVACEGKWVNPTKIFGEESK